MPSKADDVTLALRKFDADLVDGACVLSGVAAPDYLLQGAVVFEFALDYFEFDDVGVVPELDAEVDATTVAGAFGYDREVHASKEAVNHRGVVTLEAGDVVIAVIVGGDAGEEALELEFNSVEVGIAQSECYVTSCIASYDYKLAGRLPLQRARESLTELKQQMAAEGDRHG